MMVSLGAALVVLGGASFAGAGWLLGRIAH